MIYYIVTRAHANTIIPYLKNIGRSIEPYLYGRIKVLFYEELTNMRYFLKGTYIFSDLERLSTKETIIAVKVYESLKNSNAIVLNNPLISMRRYELLRSLYEIGINQFNVYRSNECRKPSRFPVFLHSESMHDGGEANLITTPEELEEAMLLYLKSGHSREDTLIEEFCDTSCNNTIYRKYSAFRVGDCVNAYHLVFGLTWNVKSHQMALTEDRFNEECEYLFTNAHTKELKTIFDLARIDYGRIDYSLKDGKIQVWEINTNPTLNLISKTAAPEHQRIKQWRAKELHTALLATDRKFNSSQKIKNPYRKELMSSALSHVYQLLPLSVKKKLSVKFKRRVKSLLRIK